MIIRFSIWFCELPLWVQMLIGCPLSSYCGFMSPWSGLLFVVSWILLLEMTMQVWTREHQRRLDCELQQYTKSYIAAEFNLTNVNN